MANKKVRLTEKIKKKYSTQEIEAIFRRTIVTFATGSLLEVFQFFW